MNRVRGRDRLRVKDLDSLPVGYHDDGGGLRFRVEPNESRSWVLRVTINGRRLSRGLGSYPDVTLEAAREEATDYRRAARKGIDLKEQQRQQAARAITFRQAFERYFEIKGKGLSNSHQRVHWTSYMRDYVFPKIGNKPVGDVTQADVIEVLKPIWYDKAETGRRVRQRMGAVFDFAWVQGWRANANPCTGVVEALGGTAHRRVKHRPALPYAEVPAFIERLHATQDWPARSLGLEWLILTATRSAETRGAVWAEFDEKKALWTIPTARMKTNEPHVVPLSKRCLEILQMLRATYPSAPDNLLFPGKAGHRLHGYTLTKILRDQGLPDGATVHGFRSSFKDWCAEAERVRDEVSEAALSHAVKGQVRAAYLRTKFLPERVGLMERWAAYCCT
jgi:integrase